MTGFIVDDNPGDRALIRRMLRELPLGAIEIQEAWNLEDTLEGLRGGGIDFVLLDLNLPGSRGVDTVSKIRSVNPTVPIIVITGSEDQQTALDVVGKGAQGHLVKGKFDIQTLGRAIEQCLAKETDPSGAATSPE